MNSSSNATDDGFDLPRWQQHDHAYLANSPAAAQYSSLYGAVPPNPDHHSISHRLPPLSIQSVQNSSNNMHQLSSAPARQQPPSHLSPIHQAQTGSLARSLSMSGSTAPLSSRTRHHMEDLESAYSIEPPEPMQQRQLHQPPSQNPHSQQPTINASFYPSSVAYASSGNQQYVSNTGQVAASHDPYGSPSAYEAQHSPRGAPPQKSSPAMNVNAQRKVPGLDPFGQSPSIYQSSAIYSNNAYADTQQLHQGQSKPSTPYANPPHQQPTSVSSPAQYSPSYPSSVDIQPPPTSVQSRPRHNHSMSQTHMQQPYQPPLSTTSNPSSPMGYQTHPPTNYFTPPIKDEPMDDMLPPPVQSARPNSSRETRSFDMFAAATGVSRKSTPMEVSRQRRPAGLRRIRDVRDLRPMLNAQPAGRRADPTKPGAFLSPLLCLTTNLSSTYSLCNPQFRYESSHNPRRVLTKPSKPAHNEGFDNEDYDYILYVNDWLGSEDGNKYLILDVLGQGTFGQVVKCQNMKTHDVVAVKVVKNKPAYFNQSMMEVTILDLLNNQHDPNDEHHILRMLDSFVHKNHLCLVFELLSQNLYELIKQNQFQGLSTQLVKVFTAQLLDALCVLKDARLIHCDLKPENILLKSLSSPGIKVIDFGSACHERQTVYTYIQSRFYRSPEVLLGLSYNSAIDMWSLGCIAVELFLGLPLFPGTSEYNQITRIVEMLGLPPNHMLEHGKQTAQFFDSYPDAYGQKQYKLKSIEQYSREHNTQEQPGKQYFKATTLPEIINIAPMPASRHSSSSRPASTEIEREANNRAAFIDFCMGLLSLNPMERWTPQQARRHPFITGEKFVKRWQPYASITEIPTPAPALTPTSTDPRRPYGGLVQSQPKGSRAYQDAAAYNQQLNQHQAYTAQQQAAQATTQAYRNPYVAASQNTASQPSTSLQAYSNRNEKADYNHQMQQQQTQPLRDSHQNTYAQPNQNMQPPSIQPPPGVASMPVSQTYVGQTSQPVNISGNPNPPSNSYYPNARTRANTINQMDVVPPALARLTQMNKDLSGVGRNTLTPIINREDAMREWERRQAGKAQPAQSYPQLEYLQQQAELASSGGWQQSTTTANRYPPPSNIMQYQTPVQLLMDNQERRRERSHVDQRHDYSSMPAPPQTSYSGNDNNLGTLYAPMQPNQYGASQQASLYGSAVVASGQVPSNTYVQKPNHPSLNQVASTSRDTRRNSAMGMENWTRGS